MTVNTEMAMMRDLLHADPRAADRGFLADIIQPPDGYDLQDNITDYALSHFHEQYGDPAITKDDIFFYCYGLLHNLTYRAKYKNNLKKELPRITMAQDFWAHSTAGRRLTWLHAFYEELDGYEGARIETPLGFDPDNPAHYRFEKIRWLDKTKTSLRINDWITIHDIPATCHQHLVSGKSPLDWLVDRYKVKTDKATGIINDANDLFDEPSRNVLLLAKQLMEVAIETAAIVDGLPEDCDGMDSGQPATLLIER